MRFEQAVTEMMAGCGMTKARLARATGTSPQVLNDRLGRSRDIRLSTLGTMADALGYDVALVPKWSSLPEGSYTLDCERPPKEER